MCCSTSSAECNVYSMGHVTSILFNLWNFILKISSRHLLRVILNYLGLHFSFLKNVWKDFNGILPFDKSHTHLNYSWSWRGSDSEHSTSCQKKMTEYSKWHLMTQYVTGNYWQRVMTMIRLSEGVKSNRAWHVHHRSRAQSARNLWAPDSWRKQRGTMGAYAEGFLLLYSQQ